MCGPKPYGNFFVYFTAFLGNLLTISYGFMFGMSPPTFLLYKSEKGYLSDGPLTDDSISWITTYLFIGAGVGAIFFKHLSHSFGRRGTLMIAGIIQNLGWFGAVFGYNFSHICISRFLVGLSGGGALAILPIYYVEISQTAAVEQLHVAIYTFQGLGIMLGYFFATFADNLIASIAGMVISVLFSMSFPFVQESPYHFLLKNDMTSLEKSLRYFRAIRDLDQRSLPEFLAEVEIFKQKRKSMNGNCISKSALFENQNVSSHGQSRCSVFQGFVSGLVLMATAQLCGLLTILNYSTTILDSIGTVWPVDMSSLLLAVSAFVGSLLGLLVAPCSWRKFVVVSFSLVTGLCLATLGYFVHRKEPFDDINFDMKWIPLICLILFILLASASIYPMAFIILSELFPKKNLDILHSFYYFLYWTLGALLIKFHFKIIDSIGMHLYFWTFSGVCLFQCIALIFILPKKQQKNL